MNEYTVLNEKTNEMDIFFGYTFEDACRRSKVNENDYTILDIEYID